MSISRSASQRVLLTVLLTRSGETVCAYCLYEEVVIILLPPLVKEEREKSVGSVGSVGKSEKSPEKIL